MVGGRGRLIAFEGIDGCGKSTQAASLAREIGAVSTREPGGTAVGRRLREILLTADGMPVSGRAEALLMIADRAQHVEEVVGPALDRGRWVVSDRFTGSTLAYQGYGRGLDLGDLEQLAAFATGGLVPDLTILIDLPPEEARLRSGAREPDRLERLEEGFHHRVREGYLALAASGGDRWAVVDGRGTVEEVATAVRAVVGERLEAGTGTAP